MEVIISLSGLDVQLMLSSSKINRAMALLNKKPILGYILDELYSYSDFIGKIYIVGNNLEEVENFFKFDYKDEFFKTKIVCLKNEDSSGFATDFYSAIEYMADNQNMTEAEVLIWRGNELLRKTKVFTDYSIGSFQCYDKDRKINVYKMVKFPHIVNNLLYLKENNSLDMETFLNRYQEWDTMKKLDYDFEYVKLDNDIDFYNAECEFINNDSHKNHYVSVDLRDQTIEFLNKYSNINFSRKCYDICRNIQWDLWSEYNFLEYANSEQMAYLPYPINRSIDMRGEYCDRVKLRWIPDASLKYTMLYQTINQELWKNIFDKVCYILSSKFHKKEDSPAFRIDKPIIEDWIRKLLHNAKCAIPPVLGKRKEIYFWMELYDKFEADLRKYINYDTLFYNGIENRLVFGDLSLEHIKCNLSNGDIHFVSPLYRTRKIVSPMEDYSSMLTDTYCLYSLFECGKYIDYGKNGVDMPDYIGDSAENITSAISNNISDIELMKEYSLFLSLMKFFDIPDDNKMAFFNFLNFRVREILNG